MAAPGVDVMSLLLNRAEMSLKAEQYLEALDHCDNALSKLKETSTMPKKRLALESLGVTLRRWDARFRMRAGDASCGMRRFGDAERWYTTSYKLYCQELGYTYDGNEIRAARAQQSPHAMRSQSLLSHRSLNSPVCSPIAESPIVYSPQSSPQAQAARPLPEEESNPIQRKASMTSSASVPGPVFKLSTHPPPATEQVPTHNEYLEAVNSIGYCYYAHAMKLADMSKGRCAKLRSAIVWYEKYAAETLDPADRINPLMQLGGAQAAIGRYQDAAGTFTAALDIYDELVAIPAGVPSLGTVQRQRDIAARRADTRLRAYAAGGIACLLLRLKKKRKRQAVLCLQRVGRSMIHRRFILREDGPPSGMRRGRQPSKTRSVHIVGVEDDFGAAADSALNVSRGQVVRAAAKKLEAAVVRERAVVIDECRVAFNRICDLSDLSRLETYELSRRAKVVAAEDAKRSILRRLVTDLTVSVLTRAAVRIQTWVRGWVRMRLRTRDNAMCVLSAAASTVAAAVFVIRSARAAVRATVAEEAAARAEYARGEGDARVDLRAALDIHLLCGREPPARTLIAEEAARARAETDRELAGRIAVMALVEDEAVARERVVYAATGIGADIRGQARCERRRVDAVLAQLTAGGGIAAMAALAACAARESLRAKHAAREAMAAAEALEREAVGDSESTAWRDLEAAASSDVLGIEEAAWRLREIAAASMALSAEEDAARRAVDASEDTQRDDLARASAEVLARIEEAARRRRELVRVCEELHTQEDDSRDAIVDIEASERAWAAQQAVDGLARMERGTLEAEEGTARACVSATEDTAWAHLEGIAAEDVAGIARAALRLAEMLAACDALSSEEVAARSDAVGHEHAARAAIADAAAAGKSRMAAQAGERDALAAEEAPARGALCDAEAAARGALAEAAWRGGFAAACARVDGGEAKARGAVVSEELGERAKLEEQSADAALQITAALRVQAAPSGPAGSGRPAEQAVGRTGADAAAGQAPAGGGMQKPPVHADPAPHGGIDAAPAPPCLAEGGHSAVPGGGKDDEVFNRLESFSRVALGREEVAARRALLEAMGNVSTPPADKAAHGHEDRLPSASEDDIFFRLEAFARVALGREEVAAMRGIEEAWCAAVLAAEGGDSISIDDAPHAPPQAEQTDVEVFDKLESFSRVALGREEVAARHALRGAMDNEMKPAPPAANAASCRDRLPSASEDDIFFRLEAFARVALGREEVAAMRGIEEAWCAAVLAAEGGDSISIDDAPHAPPQAEQTDVEVFDKLESFSRVALGREEVAARRELREGMSQGKGTAGPTTATGVPQVDSGNADDGGAQGAGGEPAVPATTEGPVAAEGGEAATTSPTAYDRDSGSACVEARRAAEAEETAAATRIQARHRGNVARAGASSIMAARTDLVGREAAARDMVSHDEYTEWGVRSQRIDACIEETRQAAAATKIQALHRGKVGREQARGIAALRMDLVGQEDAARGMMINDNDTERTALGERLDACIEATRVGAAAVKIQALHRGNAGREQAQRVMSARADLVGREGAARETISHEEDRERAAATEQRAACIEETRQGAAAVKIQALHRGREGRALAEELAKARRDVCVAEETARSGVDDEEQNGWAALSAVHAEGLQCVAATRIQAVQRGHTARMTTAAMREAIAALSSVTLALSAAAAAAFLVPRNREAKKAAFADAVSQIVSGEHEARATHAGNEKHARSTLRECMQSRGRGMLQSVKQTRERAASRLQAVARGHQRGRAAAHVLLRESRRDTAGAAIAVAAGAVAARCCEEAHAATQIQRAQRGHSARARVKCVRGEREALEDARMELLEGERDEREKLAVLIRTSSENLYQMHATLPHYLLDLITSQEAHARSGIETRALALAVDIHDELALTADLRAVEARVHKRIQAIRISSTGRSPAKATHKLPDPGSPVGARVPDQRSEPLSPSIIAPVVTRKQCPWPRQGASPVVAPAPSPAHEESRSRVPPLLANIRGDPSELERCPPSPSPRLKLPSLRKSGPPDIASYMHDAQAWLEVHNTLQQAASQTSSPHSLGPVRGAPARKATGRRRTGGDAPASNSHLVPALQAVVQPPDLASFAQEAKVWLEGNSPEGQRQRAHQVPSLGLRLPPIR